MVQTIGGISSKLFHHNDVKVTMSIFVIILFAFAIIFYFEATKICKQQVRHELSASGLLDMLAESDITLKNLTVLEGINAKGMIKGRRGEIGNISLYNNDMRFMGSNPPSISTSDPTVNNSKILSFTKGEGGLYDVEFFHNIKASNGGRVTTDRIDIQGDTGRIVIKEGTKNAGVIMEKHGGIVTPDDVDAKKGLMILDAQGEPTFSGTETDVDMDKIMKDLNIKS